MSSPRRGRPTAMAVNVPTTLSTRLPSTKRVRKARPPRVEDVTTENNQGTVVRPSQSSERRPKLPRKLPSGCNARNAKEEESSWWAVPRQSFWWTSKKSRRRTPVRETPCTSDSGWILFKFYQPSKYKSLRRAFLPNAHQAVVLVWIERLRVMAVGCFFCLLFEQSEAFTQDIFFELLPADLDGDLVEHILVVKKERPVVDPDSSGFENSIDCINILEDIVGSV